MVLMDVKLSIKIAIVPEENRVWPHKTIMYYTCFHELQLTSITVKLFHFEKFLW